MGCGSTAPTEDESGSKAKPGKKAEPKKALTALKADGTGTLKGKVTYAGDPPKPEKQDFSKADPKSDIAVCEAGTEDEKIKQTWKVGPNKGVAEVVVWVQPAAGSYFELTDDKKKPAQSEVIIDQPHCAFQPHVAVVFPTYFDGKKQQPTGQKLTVKNSAPIKHNTNWTPSKSLINRGDNRLVTAQGLEIKVVSGKETEAAAEEFVPIRCQIHPWMSSFVWVLDHPFAAVTDKEGNYEIKGVPAADLTVKYWHESFDKTPKTEKITIKGDTTKDFTVSAK